jgi:heme exporter protein A
MNEYSLEIKNLSKKFGRRQVFNNINLSINENTIFGISGANGSGKSTFMKIVAGVLTQDQGKVIHYINNTPINSEKLFNHIGFVSPYLVLYEEFTAEENLIIFSKIRGINYDVEYTKYLFNQLNLYKRRKEIIKTYSSGMKQRMKYIFALIHKPNLLLLDEPTSNLDSEGKSTVYSIVNSFSKEKIVIIASNEEQDLEFCKDILHLENYK